MLNKPTQMSAVGINGTFVVLWFVSAGEVLESSLKSISLANKDFELTNFNWKIKATAYKFFFSFLLEVDYVVMYLGECILQAALET